jgi:peptidoglycan/LPS O-acetylase OafA/YrhL
MLSLKRESSVHIASIDFLRAFAALGVCFFHLARQADDLPQWFFAISSQGKIGVQIFFVVTGFVIPYSLYRAGYSYRDFGTYICKRLIRLEPSFIACLLLAVLMWWSFGFYQDVPLNLNVQNFLLHFGYLIGVAKLFGADVNWYVGVFWTLGIELQYYLFAALCFPLLMLRSFPGRLWVFASAVLSQAVAMRMDATPIFVCFADLFLLGLVTFHRHIKLSSPAEFVAGAVMATASIGLRNPEFFVYGPLICLLILRVEIDWAVTRWLGKISYSLYLFHAVFGLWFVGALKTVARLDALPAFVFGMSATLVFSWAMWWLIERPALKAANTLAYANRIPSIAVVGGERLAPRV